MQLGPRWCYDKLCVGPTQAYAQLNTCTWCCMPVASANNIHSQENRASASSIRSPAEKCEIFPKQSIILGRVGLLFFTKFLLKAVFMLTCDFVYKRVYQILAITRFAALLSQATGTHRERKLCDVCQDLQRMTYVAIPGPDSPVYGANVSPFHNEI